MRVCVFVGVRVLVAVGVTVADRVGVVLGVGVVMIHILAARFRNWLFQ